MRACESFCVLALLASGCADPRPPRRDAWSAAPSPLATTRNVLTDASPDESMAPSDASPTRPIGSAPPDATPRAHCVVFTLKTRNPSRVADFVRRAATDGIVVNEDSGLHVAFMTDEKIASVFGGTVTYRRMPSSAASSGRKAFLTVANLEPTAIPARYADDLASIAIGHQICE